MPTRASLIARLTDTAGYQEGFFSAAQAAAAGIDRYRLRRLVNAGLVERDVKGVYRFANYAPTERAELWRATLWPSVSRSTKKGQLPLGVLSHGSALELYNVTTINPNKIEVTIPKSFRVRREIPKLYRLHRADLNRDEIDRREGLPVTTLYRTLLDLITERREHQFVDEALANHGILTESQRQRLLALRALDEDVIENVLLKMRKRP